jgi:hypothetical protein
LRRKDRENPERHRSRSRSFQNAWRKNHPLSWLERSRDQRDQFHRLLGRRNSAASKPILSLYLLPSVQHCGDGPGADSFGALAFFGPKDAQHNVQTAFELWVEKGVAPSSA